MIGRGWGSAICLRRLMLASLADLSNIHRGGLEGGGFSMILCYSPVGHDLDVVCLCWGRRYSQQALESYTMTHPGNCFG